MNSYYFISGLPRSGSTLLSSILSQNPNFYADISSPLESATGMCLEVISASESNLLVNEEQRKNVIYGIFDGYYKHRKEQIIFDTSRTWTKKTSFLKSLFPYTKILCTVRDIVSILNSFEIIFSKNPFYPNTIVEESSLESCFERCDLLMKPADGTVSKSLMWLNEGYYFNPEMIYIIEYEDLCREPEKTMRQIYEFLEKPYFPHNFKEVGYSNDLFDEKCNLKGLHTVRNEVEYNPPRNILPPEIVKKYSGLEFWRKQQNLQIQY